MTKLQFQIIGAAALVLAGIIGWSWIAKGRAESNQAAAESKVAKIEGQVIELGRQNTELANLRDQEAEKNKDLQKIAADWEKKANAWHRPPPPPPVPESDPDLAASLIQAGFVAGLRVVPEGPGTMPRQDASLAYQWQGLAAQLPTYQAQVETQGKAIEAGALAIDGLNTELATCDKQRSSAQREADLQMSKARAESDAKDAIKKQLKAEKTQRWFWAAGAAIVTYLVRK